MAKPFKPQLPACRKYDVVERKTRYEVWQAKPLVCVAQIPTNIIDQRQAAFEIAAALELALDLRRVCNRSFSPVLPADER